MRYHPDDEDTITLFKALAFVFIVGGIITGSILLINYINRPAKGTWKFATCKAFIEQYVRYPDSIKYLSVFEGPDYATAELAYENPHGFRPTRIFNCYFRSGPNSGDGIILSRIVINSDRVPPEIVDAFNRSMPVILSLDEESLTPNLPDRLPNTLQNLKR